jgi:hypothetical protein
MNREDMKHHWYKLLLNDELHLAPIGTSPGKILDLGTGTGIWPVRKPIGNPVLVYDPFLTLPLITFRWKWATNTPARALLAPTSP